MTNSDQRGRFDFAVGNGRLVGVTHTISFDRPKAEDKIPGEVRDMAWVIQDARQGGRVTLGDGREYQFLDPEISMVYVPPSERPEQQDAFHEASRVFNSLGVNAIACTDHQSLSALAGRLAEGLDRH